MRIHRFSNLIRLIFDIIAIIVAAFSILALVIDLLINGSNPLYSLIFLIVLISVCCAKALTECVIALLNRLGKENALFYNDRIIYKNREYRQDTLTFRYFKFSCSPLESVLVIPKLLISFPDGERALFYISKRQLKRLKGELEYNIIEM